MINNMKERIILAVALTGLYVMPGYCADKKDPITDEPLIRLGGQMSVVSITHPVNDFNPYQPLEPQIMTRGMGYQYPTVPLAGFTPYIAITTSNRGSSTGSFGDVDMEHQMQTGYVGSPLRSQAGYPGGPFAIGILDTGADTDLIAGTTANLLGVTGSWLTTNTMDLSGAGGDTLSAKVSKPIGYFAAGLAGIRSNNSLDPNYMIGHTNASVLSAPAIYCGGQEVVSCVLGRPTLAFTTTVIRNDIRRTINYQGQTISGPDVSFLPVGTTNIPPYSRRISMLLDGALPIQTAAWYYDINAFLFDPLNADFTPAYPTLLSAAAGSLPTSAMFTVKVDIYHGDEVESLNMMLDTGAQSSILRTYAADNLSLPLNGDFAINICGAGGLVEDIPGYYLDRVKISAGGGALNFSHAPFIVMDVAGNFDGILGMNIFYDRNITLSPDVSTMSYKLYVSDPVEFADTDFNDDNKVNLQDFALFAKSWLANSELSDYNEQCDLFLDNAIDSTDLEILLQNWLD